MITLLFCFIILILIIAAGIIFKTESFESAPLNDFGKALLNDQIVISAQSVISQDQQQVFTSVADIAKHTSLTDGNYFLQPPGLKDPILVYINFTNADGFAWVLIQRGVIMNWNDNGDNFQLGLTEQLLDAKTPSAAAPSDFINAIIDSSKQFHILVNRPELNDSFLFNMKGDFKWSFFPLINSPLTADVQAFKSLWAKDRDYASEKTIPQNWNDNLSLLYSNPLPPNPQNNAQGYFIHSANSEVWSIKSACSAFTLHPAKEKAAKIIIVQRNDIFNDNNGPYFALQDPSSKKFVKIDNSIIVLDSFQNSSDFAWKFIGDDKQGYKIFNPLNGGSYVGFNGWNLVIQRNPEHSWKWVTTFVPQTFGKDSVLNADTKGLRHLYAGYNAWFADLDSSKSPCFVQLFIQSYY